MDIVINGWELGGRPIDSNDAKRSSNIFTFLSLVVAGRFLELGFYIVCKAEFRFSFQHAADFVIFLRVEDTCTISLAIAHNK